MALSEATNAVPNPGSDEALMRDCTCPVIENGHGKGAWGGMDGIFCYTSCCPLHWPVGTSLGPFVAVEVKRRARGEGQ